MFDNIGTLDSLFADPDMEALRQKLNEMILSDTPRTFYHPSVGYKAADKPHGL